MHQQDGATPHTANISQNWCRNNLHAFLDKTEWPPSSPDLNPFGFYYWNAVVRKINMQEFFNRNDFRLQIENAMKEVSAEEIKKSILSFTNRVRQVENAGEKYIKE